MSGADLRVAMGVHKYSSPTMTDKRYIDASSTQSGDYQNKITVGGKTAYVTEAGQQAIEKYSKQDNLPEGPDMAIQEDAWGITDWFWSVTEEGIGKQ